MPPQQPRTGRIIHLFVWLATVVPTASAQTNLLRGILPSTSTSYRPSSFKPAYLTDGVKTGNYWHSWADKTPSKMLWAKVALRSRYIITRITVYNRCDSCCNERMEDIRMYVGDSKTGKEQLCGIFGYTGSCKSASLYCNLEGDFVIMRLHTSWTRHDADINICEIEAFGSAATTATTTTVTTTSETTATSSTTTTSKTSTTSTSISSTTTSTTTTTVDLTCSEDELQLTPQPAPSNGAPLERPCREANATVASISRFVLRASLEAQSGQGAVSTWLLQQHQEHDDAPGDSMRFAGTAMLATGLVGGKIVIQGGVSNGIDPNSEEPSLAPAESAVFASAPAVTGLKARAFLRSSTIYYDEPEVAVTLQIFDTETFSVVTGGTRVTVYLKPKQSGLMEQSVSQVCAGDSQGGLCHVKVPISADVFSSITSPAGYSVEYSLEKGSNPSVRTSISGSVLAMPQSAALPESVVDTVYAVVPSRPLFAGQTFVVEVRSRFRSYVNTAEVHLVVDPHLALVGANDASNFAATKTTIDGDAQKLYVVLAGRKDGKKAGVQSKPTNELLFTARVRVRGSVAAGNVGAVQITKIANFRNLDEKSMPARLAGSIHSRSGWVSGSAAKVHFDKDQILKLFAYPNGAAELINTAAITGITVSTPIAALTVTTRGVVAPSAGNALSCQSTSNQVLKSKNCIATLDGTESSGANRIAITVSANGFETSVFFRVHSLLSLKMQVQRKVLRPVAGWFDESDPSCSKLAYQPSPVTAVASFSSDGKVESFGNFYVSRGLKISSSNPDAVAVVGGSFPPELAAKNAGVSTIRLKDVSGRVWDEVAVEVKDQRVANQLGVVGLDVSLISILGPVKVSGTPPYSRNAEVDVSVTVSPPKLQYPDDSAAILVAAVFDDDSRLGITTKSGLVLTTLNPKSITVVDNVRAVVPYDPTAFAGDLVHAAWRPKGKCYTREDGSFAEVSLRARQNVSLTVSPPAATVTTSTATTETTSTTTTETVTTSSTTTRITTSTTSTTTTLMLPGTACDHGMLCSSGRCQTRCCSALAADQECSACSDVGGACYNKLAVSGSWTWPPTNATSPAAGNAGWLGIFDRDEKASLAGPPEPRFDHVKGGANLVTFRLLWGPDPSSDEALPSPSSAEHAYPTPPLGLKPAGEGLDPGNFDIDSTSGAISALPRRVGNFSMYLVAVDGGGTAANVGLPAEFDRVVIRRWDFKVVGKPNFKVVSYKRIQPDSLAEGSDTDAPYAASGKIGMLQCTAGTTYRIAPIDKAKFTYRYASGGAEAKVRFTIRNPPPGFFIDPDTGEIQGKPQAESVRSEPYTSTLLAIDAGGGEAVLEDIQFSISTAPRFNLVVQTNGQRAEKPGVKYADPTTTSSDEYFVGEDYAYKVAPLLIDKAATTVSLGAVKDVTYTLSSDAPDSFFVQAASGVIFGQFESAGIVSFALLAVDKAGKTAVVEQYTFNAIERGTFNVLDFKYLDGRNEEQHNLNGSDYTNVTEAAAATFAIGDTYKFAPLEITEAEHTDDVLSELEFSLKDAPPGFLINPTDGYIQGTPTVEGEHTMQLFAVDSLNNRALVQNITLIIKPHDYDVPEYGPNNAACEHGLTVDAVPFDQAFACNCNATLFQGPNCAVPIPAASAAAAAESGGSTPVVVGALAGGMVLFVLIGIAVYRRKLYHEKMKAFDFKAEIARLIGAGEIDEAEDDGTDSGPKIPREIKRTNVTMIQMIGEGAFGEVWRAVLDESSAGGVPGYSVAVKTSKEAKGEGAEEMLREATVMAQVSGHPNLVSLIGVVTSGVPLLLAISMCDNGSLLSLLKDRKLKGKSAGKPPFTVAERIKFGIDTAKGMAHLTANAFVHRDLAARNILVDATMTCKVADFGLARGIAGARAGPGTNEDGDEEEYYRSRTGTFPVRWTSPEAMQTMRFSEATDVWSFSVVLIEIFTDGGKPYAGMANAAVISKVQGGYRAEQPKLCPDAVYTIMLKCWSARPADRPTFVQLETLLRTAAEDASAATTSNAPSGGAGETSKTKGKKKKKKTSTTTTKADQREAVAVNDTYMSDAPAGATLAGSRQSVAVNDTYMTDEPAPAEEMADQYLTVDNAGGAGGAGADDEYLSVAAGLHGGTIDDGLDSDNDIEL